MSDSISRRNFMKLSLLTLGSLAARPFREDPPEEEYPIGEGRVAAHLVYVYEQPSFSSRRTAKIFRDELIHLFDEIKSSNGPKSNPLWYRLSDGFIHSGSIQRVDGHHFNSPLKELPAKKILGMVTVPFSQTYRINRLEVWKPLYRLYYQSVHWITGIKQGPDQRSWYQLTDERLLAHYYIPAAHIRPVFSDEVSPLNAHSTLEKKRLVISISEQSLSAFENDTLIFKTLISSGLLPSDKRNKEHSTETPLGSFRIQTKFPVRHMGNGYLTDDPDAYELPGVPWTMFFHESGFALHGTYWHNNFGTRMSQGCINMRNEEAYWLFRWTDPIYQPGEWFTYGTGTLVQITE
jgi:hypothetical protein